MDKKVYLVDTENVSTRWMVILPELKELDMVLLFYTPASGKYTLNEIQELVKHVNQISYIRCFNGHANALDFQLSAMVGYLGKTDPDCEYIVVSDDTGFDGMIKFMRGIGLTVSRLPMKLSTTVVKDTEVVHVNEEIERKINIQTANHKPNNRNTFAPEKIAKILGFSVKDDRISWITNMLETVKAGKQKSLRVTRMVMVNNNLQKQYGPTGQAYYKKLKDSGILKRLDA